MGDHRMSIKIEAEFHGVKRKMDAWVNYNGWDGVDERVVNFFEELWDKGLWKYNEGNRRAYAEREKQEDKDKSEYARLKKKYEDGDGVVK